MAKLNDQDYQLIEQHIRGEISSEEVSSFQKKLTEDIDFAQAYKVEKDIHDSISFIEQEKLKNRLNNIHDDVMGSKDAVVKKIVPKRRWASLVAAILVGVVIGVFFLLPQAQSTDQLMADFYEKPSFAPSRGNADFNDIQKAYQENDYEQTISLIADFNEPSLQLYQGIAHLELDQYSQAEDIFSNLQSNTNINDQATWYLALTFLEMDDKEACKKELEKLMNGDISTTDFRQEKARELYEEL